MNLKRRTLNGAVFATMATVVGVVVTAENIRTSSKEPQVVFLVRHAEKANVSADPKLSSAGKKRAEELVHVLRDANIEHVHSSDFIRTRNTAAPIAHSLAGC